MSQLASLGRRTAITCERVVVSAVELFPGSIEVVSELIASSWAIIYVGVLGAVLTIFRNWFMNNADAMARQSFLITGVINLAVDLINGMVVIVELFVELFGGLTQKSFPPFKPEVLPYLNSTAFETACVELPRACANVDTPSAVFRLTVTPVASASGICGFLRYIYPVEWLFSVLYPLLSGLALTYEPYPPGTVDGPGNCTSQAEELEYEWQCVVLGSGIWLLEIILPLIILAAIWRPLAPKLAVLVGAVLLEVLDAVPAILRWTIETVDTAVFFILKKAGDAVNAAEDKID